jgi:hypothetical protein
MKQFEMMAGIWLGLCVLAVGGALYFWANLKPVPTHESGKAWYIESNNFCMMDMKGSTMPEIRSMAVWCEAKQWRTELKRMR